MSNEITIFEHEEFGKVRTILIENEPWWVLKDVCNVLGIVEAKSTARRLDNDEVRQIPIVDTKGRQNRMYAVNESGLYSVIIRSDKPIAKPFRKWITSEVLPSIRKHGAYITGQKIMEIMNDPKVLAKLFADLADTKEENKLLADKIETDKPATNLGKAWITTDEDIDVSVMAKLMKKNGGDIGQNRLYQKLRDDGYVMRRGNKNLPTQKAMNAKLLTIRSYMFFDAYGRDQMASVTQVTPKGQIYFLNKYIGWDLNVGKQLKIRTIHSNPALNEYDANPSEFDPYPEPMDCSDVISRYSVYKT